MKKVAEWVARRAKEPSTWAALVPVLAVLGYKIDGDTAAVIGAGIAALLGVILKEKAS